MKRKSIISKIFAIIMVSLLMMPNFSIPIKAAPRTIYVSTSGSNTSPYDTWEKASTSIQNAIDSINPTSVNATDTVTIEIAAGTYTENITTKYDVAIKETDDPAYKGEVIIKPSILTSPLILVNHNLKLDKLELRGPTSNNYILQVSGNGKTVTANNVKLIGQSGSRAFYLFTNSKIIFNRSLIKDVPYMFLSQTATSANQVDLNYCIVENSGSYTILGGTHNIYNTTFIGAPGMVLELNGANNKTLRFKNNIIAAAGWKNASTQVLKETSSSNNILDISNNIILPNAINPIKNADPYGGFTNLTGFVAAGTFYTSPQFVARRRPFFLNIQFNSDVNGGYQKWKEVTDYANGKGIKTTLCLDNVKGISGDAWIELKKYEEKGNTIGIQGQNHINYAVLNGIKVKGPANSTISVAINESDNSSNNWTGTIDLKVNGTITKTINITHTTKLINVHQAINATAGWTSSLAPITTGAEPGRDDVMAVSLANITDLNVATEKELSLDRNRFYFTELVETKKIAESNYLTIKLHSTPGGATSAEFRNWISTDSHGYFAKGQTTPYLASTSSVVTGSYTLSDDMQSGDPITTGFSIYQMKFDVIETVVSLASIERDIHAIVEGLGYIGGSNILLGHCETAGSYFGVGEWKSVIDALVKLNIPLNSENDTITWIRSGTNVGGSGKVFTRTFTDKGNYQLQGTSPAVDAGAVIAGLSTDFSGNSIYNVPDMGAFELAAPNAPEASTAVVGTDSIEWNFIDKSNNETGFRLYNGSTLIAEVQAVNLTKIKEIGLNNNTVYSNRYITAYNQRGESEKVLLESSCTLAPTPSNFSISASINLVTLSVDTFLNNNKGQSGYYFEKVGGNNSGWQATNTYQDNSVSCNQSLTYRVKYRNQNGVESAFVEETTNTGACPTPNTTISPNSLDFGSVELDYSAITAKDISFTNNVNVADTLTYSFSSANFSASGSSITVPASGTTTLSVTPKSGLTAGTYNETLTIKRGSDTVKTINLTLVVTNPLPSTTISPNSLDFGSVELGYSAITAKDISFTNNVNVADTLTYSFSSANFSASGSSITVPASGTTTLSVTPKSGLTAGTYNETLTIKRGSDTVKTINLTLVVTNPLPNTTVDKETLDFDDRGVGYSNITPMTVKFTNHTLLADTLTISCGSAFEIVGDTTITVPANGDVTVSVRPINGNQANIYNQLLTIKRAGTAIKTINLNFTVKNLMDDYSISIDKTSLDFGKYLQSYSGLSYKEITITNNSIKNDDLTFEIVGDFKEENNTISKIINSNTNTVLKIVPNDGLLEGSYNGSLIIKRSGVTINTVSLKFEVSEYYTQNLIDLNNPSVVISGNIHYAQSLTVVTNNYDSYCSSCQGFQEYKDNNRVYKYYDIKTDNSNSKPAFTGEITITFNLGQSNNGKTFTIVHCTSNGIETFTDKCVDGVVRVNVDELSPFVILKAGSNPSTGDNSNPIIASLIMVSALAIAGYLVLKKKNNNK